ncbi:TIGR04255 family protein [Sphingomonas hankookensis]|uniref:TIGR04255 family protein n=1 Tax=Sphingomonas hankookensis TaxID=563996 RepID=UPI00234F93DF|nr:TIGR04255 family protein [Sphingomonas hankookensis]WCP71585.1 TIGR04255 family protein [Sphingomonas hankookensis]
MNESSAPNPPIVQLVLTVSFEPALDNLSIIDLADLFRQYEREFPIFQQVNRAGPMSANPFEMKLEVGGLPRMMFASPAMDWQVAFQNDRLSVLWARTKPMDQAPDYPGFTAVADRFAIALGMFKRWLEDRGLALPKPSVSEVAYVDAFPIIAAASGRQLKMSEIIRTINPALKFPMTSLEHRWTEPLRDGRDGYALVEITAPIALADGTSALGFDTTVRMSANGEWDAVGDCLEYGHSVALEIFDRVVNQDTGAI